MMKEFAVEASKATPPVGVATTYLMGLPVEHWVLGLTAIYTVLQIFFLLRDKWWRQRGKSKD